MPKPDSTTAARPTPVVTPGVHGYRLILTGCGLYEVVANFRSPDEAQAARRSAEAASDTLQRVGV